MDGTPNHDPAGKLALMKWISTPTISLEKIRSRGSEAVAAAIGVPG